MSRPLRLAEPLGLVLPFSLWGLGFVLLYGAHGFACGTGVRPGQGEGVTRAVLALLFALHLAAQAGLAHHFWRRWRAADDETRLVRLVSLVTALGAVLAAAWTGSPVLFLSICS